MKTLISCSISLILAISGTSTLAQEAIHGHEGEQAPGLAYIAEEHNGNAQSPINILSGQATEGHHDVALHYQPSGSHIGNLGHTVEAFYEAGSTLDFDGQRYELQQMHFHTPSEHLLDGITYPMEMHMVHTLDGNPEKYLVIGVLFREGDADKTLASILANVPEHAGETADIPGLSLSASELLNFSEHYFYYEGSLTTPPYTETVTWLVMKDVHQASPEQIAILNRLEGNIARHIQDISSRHVDSN